MASPCTSISRHASWLCVAIQPYLKQICHYLVLLVQRDGKTLTEDLTQGSTALQDSTNLRTRASSHVASHAKTPCSHAHETQGYSTKLPAAGNSDSMPSSTDTKQNMLLHVRNGSSLQQRQSADAALGGLSALTHEQQSACQLAYMHVGSAIHAAALMNPPQLTSEEPQVEGESVRIATGPSVCQDAVHQAPAATAEAAPTRQQQADSPVKHCGDKLQEPQSDDQTCSIVAMSEAPCASGTYSPCQRTYSASVTTTRPVTPASPSALPFNALQQVTSTSTD